MDGALLSKTIKLRTHETFITKFSIPKEMIK